MIEGDCFCGNIRYEIAGGVHFQSQILDCAPEELYDGISIEAVFVSVGEEMTLVRFRRI